MKISNEKIVEYFQWICTFTGDYNRGNTVPKSSNDAVCVEARSRLEGIAVWLKDSIKHPLIDQIEVEYSRGAGVFPRIPWICVLPPGEKTSDGCYVSICFGKNGNGAVAGFAESTTNRVGLNVVKRTKDPKWRIDVDGPKPNTKYNDGYVNPKEFFVESFSAEELLHHIESSLDLYFDYRSRPNNQAIEMTTAHLMVRFRKLATALLAKRFMILTGNSGTGKTRVAENIAATFRNGEAVGGMSNLAMVSVGADWTDNRAVAGFVNHLREGNLKGSSEKRPVYQSTPVVDVLLSADADPSCPHFLILDEMNLSHVERYFADFLSAMESRDGQIRFHDEGSRDQGDFRLPRFEGDPVGVPRSVAYPRNLFVIGTVNVDETTYMFSPKVLDRAHVIEFVVDPDDIKSFLDNPVAPEVEQRVPESAAKAFMKISLDARDCKLAPLPETVKNTINGHLVDWLLILQSGRFEFAYRTAKEVMTYLSICHHLADDKRVWIEGHRLTADDRKTGKHNWLSDLDDEILQKILPRLHGSRNRIGPLLGALTSYAYSGELDQARAFFPKEGSELAEKSIGDPDFVALTEAGALFPRSFRKLKTMSRVLVEEQFVSFIC